ncbi:MAG TPA: class I SAM-dependent methyltransferase [Terracidiphilus sp.]|nr:class I SAM-dependent methyltransferase [Terracidiphilus sp.]
MTPEPPSPASESASHAGSRRVPYQCSKPSGWFGRLILRNMNKRHSGVTDWGLSHVSVNASDVILDVGCGGGRTIAKLASKASKGKVYGVDHSDASLAVANKTNAAQITAGQVEIRSGSVSQLPYPDGMFDLITAVETHFFWPNLPGDVREVVRVLKPGGVFTIIAEIYKGAPTTVARACEKYAPKTGMTLLTPDEHRDLLVSAGLGEVEVFTWPEKGWLCARGKRSFAV